MHLHICIHYVYTLIYITGYLYIQCVCIYIYVYQVLRYRYTRVILRIYWYYTLIYNIWATHDPFVQTFCCPNSELERNFPKDVF